MSASPACRTGILLLSAVAAWVALPDRSAFAADPPAPSLALQSEADRLFEEAISARKADKLADAEALFQKAWALKKTWDIAANLGLVELKLGKLAEGAERVAYAIANLPPTESDSTRESLAKALAAARSSVGEVDVRCDTSGAEVWVGGQLRGTTPLAVPLFVMPGQVTIDVRKDGYTTERKTIEVSKASTHALRFALVKQTVAPPEMGPRRAVWVTGAAVAGAGVIAGAVLLGVSAGTKAEAENLRDETVAEHGSTACANDGLPVCKQQRDTLNRASTMFGAGAWSLIGAGLIAAGTLSYVLITRSKGAPTVQAGAIITPAAGGASVRVSF